VIIIDDDDDDDDDDDKNDNIYYEILQWYLSAFFVHHGRLESEKTLRPGME
jgi:hypothetical protein